MRPLLKTLLLILPGAGFILSAILLSLTAGSADISPAEALKVLIQNLLSLPVEELEGNAHIIIMKIRLPRIIMAALTGASLTVSGIVYQSVLKNPLAEPYILGISSGAALGAASSIVLGFQMISSIIPGHLILAFSAFSGALITSAAVLSIAGMTARSSRILLFGISVSFLLSSFLSMLIAFNRDKTEDIIFWTLGSFTAADISQIQILFPVVFLGTLFIALKHREMDILTMGGETALSLGINVRSTRLTLLALSSLMTAVTVAFTGIIGFVGLIIPHAVRLFSGSNHRKLLLISIPAGSIFMIFCDTLARTAAAPTEIPVSVLTSLLGAPFFIYLLKRKGTQ